jgi:hypothetical protein
MLVAFLAKKGLVYMHILPRDVTINANYTIIVLGKFMKHLRGSRGPRWSSRSGSCTGTMRPSTPPPLSRIGWPPERSRCCCTPYSPDLVPADFFLFRKVKEELAGLHLTQDSLKSAWEGVMRNITEDEFAVAYSRWLERWEKCIHIGGDYVEKSGKINTFLTITIVFLLKYSSLILIPPHMYLGLISLRIM